MHVKVQPMSESQMHPELAAVQETNTLIDLKNKFQSEAPEAKHPVPCTASKPGEQEITTAGSKVKQEQEENNTTLAAAQNDRPSVSSPSEVGEENEPEENFAVSSEMDKDSLDNVEHRGEINPKSQKPFGPPAKPPPPPTAALENSQGEDTR